MRFSRSRTRANNLTIAPLAQSNASRDGLSTIRRTMSVADVLPELSPGPPLSKVGDLWLLGRHRLLCSTALDSAAFTALMAEERAPMIFTDPPYNVRIDGHASGLGAIHHRPFPMASAR
jgi:hypothetical protein